MNKLILAVVGLLAGLCTLSLGAQAGASPSDLGSLDWSTKQAQSLNAESNDAIANFMNNLPNTAGTFHVCSFQFADLRHSGQLSLIVSYDTRGTADCNMVSVFDRTRAGIEWYDFGDAGLFYFDSIEDINGDGNYEVVLDQIFASTGMSSASNHCVATWPVIYAWTGAGYSNVSSDYKGYYEKQLVSLQKNIAEAEAQKEQAEEGAAAQNNGSAASAVSNVPQSSNQSPASIGGFPAGVGFLPSPTPAASISAPPDKEGLDCIKAINIRIESFLGISSGAGMNDAIKWSESDDPATRRFAARMLAEIGTPEAIEDLQTLSHDPDPHVARSAKNNLRHIKRSYTTPMVQGELIVPSAK